MPDTETNISILDTKTGQYIGNKLAFDVQVPKSGQWKGWAFVKGGLPKADLDKLGWRERKTIAKQRPGHYVEYVTTLTREQEAALVAVLTKNGVVGGRIEPKDDSAPPPSAGRHARPTTTNAVKSIPLSQMLDTGLDVRAMNATSYTNDGLSFVIQKPTGKFKGWLFMRGGVTPEVFASTTTMNLPMVGKQPPNGTFHYVRMGDTKVRAALLRIIDTYALKHVPKGAPVPRTNKEALATSPVAFEATSVVYTDEEGNIVPKPAKAPQQKKREQKQSVRDKVRARYGIT